MEKILRGILNYKSNAQGNFLVRWATREQKRHVKPPILFISCIDARILPTHFCQTSPGDMFILRNAGNVIPRANYLEGEPSQLSCEVVALEITCNRSKVEHVVVCGHSDCQALHAFYNHYTHQETKVPIKKVSNIIHAWCRTHGVEDSLHRIQDLAEKINTTGSMTFDVGDTPLEAQFDTECRDEMNLLDKLSQVNVLQQLEHLSSYRSIRHRVSTGSLSLHGMWYDVITDNIYWFSRRHKAFIDINEENIEEIVESCRRPVCTAEQDAADSIGDKTL